MKLEDLLLREPQIPMRPEYVAPRNENAVLSDILNSVASGKGEGNFNQLMDLYANKYDTAKPKNMFSELAKLTHAMAESNRAHPEHGLGPAISRGIAAVDAEKEARRKEKFSDFEKLYGVAEKERAHKVAQSLAKSKLADQEILNDYRKAQTVKALRGPLGKAGKEPKVYALPPKTEEAFNKKIAGLQEKLGDTPINDEVKALIMGSVADEYARTGNVITAWQNGLANAIGDMKNLKPKVVKKSFWGDDKELFLDRPEKAALPEARTVKNPAENDLQTQAQVWGQALNSGKTAGALQKIFQANGWNDEQIKEIKRLAQQGQ